MRLSDNERSAIRVAVAKRFGAQARVLLFGSRVDESRRGRDIDLFVEVPHTLSDSLTEAVQLEIDVMRAPGERNVDVLLTDPGLEERPIRRIAHKTAIAL